MDDVERLALAHALRTPLTSALLAAGALGAGPLNATQLEALRTLEEDLRRLQVLCARALDVSRAGAHAGPLERHRIDLQDLVDRAVEPLRSQAVARNVAVSIVGRRVAPVLADPTKLAWALAALLGNAVRYAQSSVEVRLSARRGSVVVTIADDGPGIAPERIDRLFERDGPGLGLYLVREVIDAHGGLIEARSRRGTCFVVTLPAHENEP